MTSQEVYNSEEYKELKKELKEAEKDRDLFIRKIEYLEKNEQKSQNRLHASQMRENDMLELIFKIVNKDY